MKSRSIERRKTENGGRGMHRAEEHRILKQNMAQPYQKSEEVAQDVVLSQWILLNSSFESDLLLLDPGENLREEFRWWI
ncbi:hypothetical protein SCP_0406600 [Sparassis crispa]|uniref:Uncharacterized protein n=1 Tax=Sparassis crispa TaxID=139825 RepID=A0A401GJD3_9APHY|nr:hypothetical protein SCP_0406600 [Sparassis crispa]GBE82276.1 hypothetical protein SCP_0406600 [Sparassis crispa]